MEDLKIYEMFGALQSVNNRYRNGWLRAFMAMREIGEIIRKFEEYRQKQSDNIHKEVYG